MEKTIFSIVPGYKPINLTSSYLLFEDLQVSEDLFARTPLSGCFCFFQSKFLNQTNSMCICIGEYKQHNYNPSLCNVVYYKETIILICSPHQLAGFCIITSTAK